MCIRDREYKPHDVHILINDHEIGNLTNTIPEGEYAFKFDPFILNYPDSEIPENRITLKTEHLNGGHYVVSSDMKLVLCLKRVEMAVCAENQTEADSIVKGMSSAMTHKPDFSAYKRGINFSCTEPTEGEEITINATIYNFGTMGMMEVPVQFLDNGALIENRTIPYISMLGNETLSVSWTATKGSHAITVKVNPDKTIEETDYSNNEASKDIFVQEKKDTTLPTIANVKPGRNQTAESGDLINFSCFATDAESAVESVWLNYTTDNWTTHSTKIMENPYDSLYRTNLTLPAVEVLKYKIEARDEAGNIGSSEEYTIDILLPPSPSPSPPPLQPDLTLAS